MLTGLRLNVFVLLLSPVFTERNSIYKYFEDGHGDISLKGPDNPGEGTFVWEWEPHSRQEKQQLVTFKKTRTGSWNAEWSEYYRNNNWHGSLSRDHRSPDLRLREPKFDIAGMYTLFQTRPNEVILKSYNIFGIKVESNAQYPYPRVGSDVTLSCTISKLSDTVFLQWKRRDLSQQRDGKTDQIRVNNTVYLMVKHVTVEDEKLYVCEVQENGFMVLKVNQDFHVSENLHQQRYTLYRSGTDRSELNLTCYYYYYYHGTAAWSWRSDAQHEEKIITFASRSQSLNITRIHFGNRLVPTTARFDGKNFNVRIVPVLFEDAGVYTCSMQSNTILTITLITVKVTVEPSDVETVEDSVTLICSVSDVTESMRLVWVNSNGNIVKEKAFTVRNKEDKSLRLIVWKGDRGRRKWTCVLFHQNMPQVSVPYYMELRGNLNEAFFLHQEGYFLLKGPDNPGNSSIIWEWKPHSGQQATKQLGTFHREGQHWAVKWSDDYNDTPDISRRMYEHYGTLNLLIRNPSFELGGLFTWTQTEPIKKILKQIELFVIKVEMDSQWPVMGSDITLSCTISRLSDTINLEWKQRNSSQENRRINTDDIQLNNTVYLIIRHAGAKNQNLYAWEVQENNSIILTGKTNIDVNQNLHDKKYTLYRSVTDQSELELICEVDSTIIKTKWTWSSHLKNKDQEIASTYKSKPVNINRAYFGSRLVPPVSSFTDRFFSVRIVPVLFEDAGVYRCFQGSNNHLTINLITVKVTAELSDAETEGGSVTLTCSVSDVTESMRLAWIDSGGKIIAAKTFKEHKQEEDNLQLITQEFDRDSSYWACILFHENIPKVLIPYDLKLYTSVRPVPVFWIIAVSVYLVTKLVFVVGLIFHMKKINRKSSSRILEKPTRNKEAVGLQILNSSLDL